MSNRFTIPAKRQHNTDVSIILIHTESIDGKSTALKRVGGKIVIDSQIQTIKNMFGETADIVVITGYNHDEVEKYLNRTARVVYNNIYKDQDYAYSVYLGLINTTGGCVFIIDGGMPLTGQEFAGSFNCYIRPAEKGDIGILVKGDEVSHFSYGLKTKLGNIIYLNKDGIKKFMEIYNSDHILQEVLNQMIESGLVIKI